MVCVVRVVCVFYGVCEVCVFHVVCVVCVFYGVCEICVHLYSISNDL